MNKPLLSIVMPVKDEKENIEWVITEIAKYLKPRHEILVVYDTDTDNTLPVVRRLQKLYANIKIIKNNYGKGVVAATLKGFDKSNGEILVMMAADRTDDVKTLNIMYKKILQGYDIICPTRYSKGGKVVGKTSIKSLLSRLAGTTTPFILNIPTSDLTYSYKMFKKEILKNIKIESKGGFEFAEELLIKAHHLGYKIIEVPTLWIDRTYGKSKFKLMKWLPRYIYWYTWGFKKRIGIVR